MRGMQETRGILAWIPENILETVKYYHFNTPGNIIKDFVEFLRRFCVMFDIIAGHVLRDSGECSRRFLIKIKKITGNIIKDSGECVEKFRGIFEKIPEKVRQYSGELKDFDLSGEILLVFIKVCY